MLIPSLSRVRSVIYEEDTHMRYGDPLEDVLASTLHSVSLLLNIPNTPATISKMELLGSKSLIVKMKQ
jgi:hypothetical protein